MLSFPSPPSIVCHFNLQFGKHTISKSEMLYADKGYLLRNEKLYNFWIYFMYQFMVVKITSCCYWIGTFIEILNTKRIIIANILENCVTFIKERIPRIFHLWRCKHCIVHLLLRPDSFFYLCTDVLWIMKSIFLCLQPFGILMKIYNLHRFF